MPITHPRIVAADRVLLAGVRVRMSFTNDRTSELWRNFRSRENEVVGRVGSDSFSVKVYGPEYSFTSFDPTAEFDKWAAVKVDWGSKQKDGFENLEVTGGDYAVFVHLGPASDASRTFGHIFRSWLPDSGYDLDRRPHFEVLPKGYDPFDPEAEEEVWVPIRSRV
ncbi:MAG: GyrI-like domain-containing protein [Pyrinomonadaceae bacterium]